MARWPRAGVTALVPFRTVVDRFLSRAARPPVDLRDDADAYVLVADLPGFEPGEVEVTVSGRDVELRASATRSEEQRAGGYLRRERWTGMVARRLTLPGPVDPAAAKAEMRSGRLVVRLPKVAPEPIRRIPIRVGASGGAAGGAAGSDETKEAA
ncbi:MAG TPA: Hsp20/alpha crystallin family protein [Candidatus Binatia bacterium]|nr:Hsp20/alpha crystallin family protein [Candidatus Binatia bacterium]